jgi:hypothetical protein
MQQDTKQQRKYAYPWAELYDMESRVLPTPHGTGRPGRPSQLYVRRRTSLMLSDEELQSLGTDLLAIQNALRPGKVTKSQVYGLAVRVLTARMEALPDRVTSWDEVVRALIEGKGE